MLPENIREDVEKSIKSEGGKIIQEFDIGKTNIETKSRQDGVPKTILIAPSCKRSIKYFAALSRGIPCVHYNWILHSIEEVKKKKFLGIFFVFLM